LRTVAVSGAAFDAAAATFPVVFATGPFEVRLVPAREVREVPFLLVERLLVDLLDALGEPFFVVDLLELERPRADRLLEDRVVWAILIASLFASLPAASARAPCWSLTPPSGGLNRTLRVSPG
jgi:hypothetical protein